MKNHLVILSLLLLSSCAFNARQNAITAEKAYQGVSNYCHSEYDWSAAEDNPSMMYVKMGEETDSAYQVIFRSYTGSFVYFYVDKASGTTKMVEYVPALDVENETGSFELSDYLAHARAFSTSRRPRSSAFCRSMGKCSSRWRRFSSSERRLKS